MVTPAASEVKGRTAKDIMRLAATWALIIRGPKPLMAYCKVTVPIETIEFISPMAIPCPKRSK